MTTIPVVGSITRREMIRATTGGVAAAAFPSMIAPHVFDLSHCEQSTASMRQDRVQADKTRDRVYGLLLGSLIGDALGGPTEFQPIAEAAKLPGGPHLWRDGEVLDQSAKQAAAQRLNLLPYGPLRPLAEPYGQWMDAAAAGTVTDDSRQKLVLFEALRKARESSAELTIEGFAQAYLDWPNPSLLQKHPHYTELNGVWLAEYRKAAC
jgi:hypothetical protein